MQTDLLENLEVSEAMAQAEAIGYFKDYPELKDFTENTVFHTDNFLAKFLIDRGFYEDTDEDYKRRGKRSFTNGRRQGCNRSVVFDYINITLWVGYIGVYWKTSITYNDLCYFILHGDMPKNN